MWPGTKIILGRELSRLWSLMISTIQKHVPERLSIGGVQFLDVFCKLKDTIQILHSLLRKAAAKREKASIMNLKENGKQKSGLNSLSNWRHPFKQS